MNEEEKTITLGNELYEEFIEGKQTIDTHELLNLFAKRINNLQSKIDKAIKWIEQYEKQIGTLGETSKSIVLTDDVVIGNLLDILKEV